MQSKKSNIIQTFIQYFMLQCFMTVVLIQLCKCDRFRFGICETEGSSARVIHGISLTKCVRECGKRQYCIRLNYRRPQKKCMFYSVPNIETGSDDKTCVVISRSELAVGDECACANGGVCQPDDPCAFKECPVVSMAPKRGKIYGNMREVGSKVKTVCKSTTTRVPDISTSQCGTDGQWQDLPRCLFKCRIGATTDYCVDWTWSLKTTECECSNICSTRPYSSVNNMDPVYDGEKKIYTCDQGFYTSRNPTNNQLHKNCTEPGWFIGPSDYCRSADVYPKHPDNIVYIGCETFEFNMDVHTKEDARKLCQPYGDLVKIDQAYIMLYILMHIDRIAPTTSFWIQGYRTSMNTWNYDDNGSPFKYSDWAVFQPDNTGSCVMLNKYLNFKMNDEYCHQTYGYICQYSHRRSFG